MIDIIKKSIKNPLVVLDYIIQPKKIYNFIIKKYFALPDLDYIGKVKNYFIKKNIINFWIFFSKRNKKIFFFFFKEISSSSNKYIFKKEDLYSNESTVLQSLADHGLIVLENILPEDEHKLIKKRFLELKDLNIKEENINANEWQQRPITTKTNTKLRIFSSRKIDEFDNLKSLSNFFSKNVYGKIYENNAEFYYDKLLKLPEDKIKGDNFMHLDRYVPNMKILYIPFGVDKASAPFTYAFGSHKINSEYIKFINNGSRFDETEKESLSFLNNKTEITAKENSLVVALTSGFHGRSCFEDFRERMIVFLQYRSFNKLSLLKL